MTATATVQAIDKATRTVTLRNEKGEGASYEAALNRAKSARQAGSLATQENLEGVKAGDRIEITYTQALLTAVDAAK